MKIDLMTRMFLQHRNCFDNSLVIDRPCLSVLHSFQPLPVESQKVKVSWTKISVGPLKVPEAFLVNRTFMAST